MGEKKIEPLEIDPHYVRNPNQLRIEQYLTTDEAMRYIRVKSKTTWAKLKKKPDFPKAYKLTGRKILYKLSQLEAWIQRTRAA